MRDDGAIYRAAKILADAPDHHPVGTRRAAVIDFAVLENRKFQIRRGGVREGEVLVVVVGVRIFVAAWWCCSDQKK